MSFAVGVPQNEDNPNFVLEHDRNEKRIANPTNDAGIVEENIPINDKTGRTPEGNFDISCPFACTSQWGRSSSILYLRRYGQHENGYNRSEKSTPTLQQQDNHRTIPHQKSVKR